MQIPDSPVAAAAPAAAPAPSRKHPRQQQLEDLEIEVRICKDRQARILQAMERDVVATLGHTQTSFSIAPAVEERCVHSQQLYALEEQVANARAMRDAASGEMQMSIDKDRESIDQNQASVDRRRAALDQEQVLVELHSQVVNARTAPDAASDDKERESIDQQQASVDRRRAALDQEQALVEQQQELVHHVQSTKEAMFQ